MVPGTADIVIIGGGVVGTSIAYHLARRGVRDPAAVERRVGTHIEHVASTVRIAARGATNVRVS